MRLKVGVRGRVVAFMLALTGIVGGCDSGECSSPENGLRTTFAERVAVLEKLRKMSDEDKSVIRIAPTFTRLETDWSWPRPAEKLGFTEARWNEYRRLFSESGVYEGLEREGASILFTTKACGLGVSGKSFGYAFLPQKPTVILKALDELHGRGVGYVPIRGDWYLYVLGI